jgi:hypothetical protein
MKFAAQFVVEGSPALITREVVAPDRIAAIKAVPKVRREVAAEIKADPLFFGLRRNDRGTKGVERAAREEGVPVRSAKAASSPRKKRAH